MDRKLVIDFNGLKRELEFPFGLCMSRTDLHHLVEQLQARLRDENWCYGWTHIHAPYSGPTANQVPIPWVAPQ